MDILAEHFEHFKVDVNSTREFLETYMRPDRYNLAKGKPDSHVQDLINHHNWNIVTKGYTFLNNFDSVTGEIVSYFPFPELEET